MTHPALTELRRHWEELRAGRLLPQRSELDPRAISAALPRGFVLERLSDRQVRFRLAGLDLSDIMGMEIRGMPLSALIVPAARERFNESLDRVFSGPEIHEYRLQSLHRTHAPLDVVMLILPLRGDDGQINRALGCLAFDGPPEDPPRRFEMLKLTRTVLADGQMESEMLRPEMGLAEAAAEFHPASRPGTPHLRLVKND